MLKQCSERSYYQQLTRMSSALALVSDVSMAVLGGDLKRKERLSARLGDVLSYLYLTSTVLKYYEDSGRKESDLPYVEWVVKTNLFKIQTAFNEFFDNFKPSWLGKVLRRIVFPYGCNYKQPSDSLEHKIVKPMFNHNELRDRLTKNVFIGTEKDPIGRIENAFDKVLATRDIAAKIKMAVKEGKLTPARELEETIATAVAAGILTQQQGDDYTESEAVRLDAMQVDEYSQEYMAGKF